MRNQQSAIQDEDKMLFSYLASIQADTCKIRFCEQFDEKSKIWNYEKHSHHFVELIYFLEGKADIIDSDRTMATSLFELVVYPAGVSHQEYLDTRYHQSIICLQLECHTTLTYPHLFKLKDQNGILRWIIKQIHSENEAPGEHHEGLITDLLRLLLDYMKKIAKEYQQPAVSTPDKCLQFIQEHFAEHIDTRRLAEETFVSTSYLNRVFRRKFNMTPIQYLNRYRMEIAREMLVQTDNKITEVAKYAGFEDPKHFSKLFRKTTGSSPAKYRSAITAIR